MNFDPKNEIQRKVLIYTSSLVLAISFFLLLSRMGSVLEFFSAVFGILLPFILGFGIAFVLNPAILWLEEKTGGFIPKKRTNRIFSCAVVFIVTIIAVGLILWIMVPALLESLQIFAENISSYMMTLETYVEEFASKLNIDYVQIETFLSSMNLISQFSGFVQNSVANLFHYSYSAISVIFRIIIGIAAAFYLSIDKEKLLRLMRTVIYALLPERYANEMYQYGRTIKAVFEQYIVGNIIDSSIVGLVCWLVCMVFNVPYSPMIGLFIGITNLIPVFGPFLGAIPVIIILLLIKPFYALFFAVFILILQQVDGNILKPVILGDKLGLSGFWILFAVTIGGSLFGIAGMFLGVPVFALIYQSLSALLKARLRLKKIHIPEESDD